MKVFFSLLILTVSLFAQTQSIFIDTLKNGGNLTKIFKPNKSYASSFITFENIGASACTLTVNEGIRIKNSSLVIYDTTWVTPWLKDYQGLTPSSIIIPVSGSRSYLIIKKYVDLIKPTLTNSSGGNVRVILQCSE